MQGYGNNGYNNGYMNNGYGNSGNGNNNGYMNTGYGNYQAPNQMNRQQQIDEHFQWVDYVSGRVGADAYPMPQGINRVLLFDNDTDRFFVKQYDNNGRPRVVEDNDFIEHVDPEPQMPNIDLSAYATKDDIQKMIQESFASIRLPDMSNYLTRKDLNKELGNYAVGNGGRIVRNNE